MNNFQFDEPSDDDDEWAENFETCHVVRLFLCSTSKFFAHLGDWSKDLCDWERDFLLNIISFAQNEFIVWRLEIDSK